MNVYDFDRTIYNGDSSLYFYFFVLLQKPYIIIFFPFFIWRLFLFILGICSKEQMKEAYFIFIRHININEMVSLFWEKNSKKIKSWYMQQKQDSDLIISASPQFLLEPLVVDFLGVKLIASLINVNTVKYIGKNCYGEEKLNRFNEEYQDSTIENFYSDNYSDISLVYISENSFLVKKDIIKKWIYK